MTDNNKSITLKNLLFKSEVKTKKCVYHLEFFEKSKQTCYLASSLHSSDSSFSADEDSGGQTSTPAVSGGATHSTTAPPVITLNSNGGLNDPILNSNNTRRGRYLPPKRNPSESSSDSGDVQHHKLTREDSERPIASEKIKKKSNHGDKEVYQFIMISYINNNESLSSYSMVKAVCLSCLYSDITLTRFVTQQAGKSRATCLPIAVTCKL